MNACTAQKLLEDSHLFCSTFSCTFSPEVYGDFYAPFPYKSGNTTKVKQFSFNTILETHSRITNAFISKHKSRWCLPDYYYVDAFCGPGLYVGSDPDSQHVVGSPLLFLEHVTAYNIPFKALFIDKTLETVQNLEAICKLKYSQDVLDNCTFMCDSWENILEDPVGYFSNMSKSPLGMMYFDPNGCLNTDKLADILSLPQFSRIDVLLNPNNTALKRTRGSLESRCNYNIKDLSKYDAWKLLSIKEAVDTLPKGFKYVRDRLPGDKHQFTPVILSNYKPIANSFSKLGFVDVHSPEGVRCMLEVSYTPKEFQLKLQEFTSVN